MAKYSIFVAEIVIRIEQVDRDHVAREWKELAERALTDSDIKNQLLPHTLSGKVWKILGNLDSLGNIIGAIDQVAKVCSIRQWSSSLIFLDHLIAQFLPRSCLENLFVIIQGILVPYDPRIASYLSMLQAVEKQHKEDQKVSDLVDQINEIFDFVQHSQEVNLDDPYWEKTVTQLLNQVTECAIFIFQHFQSSFGGMPRSPFRCVT